MSRQEQVAEMAVTIELIARSGGPEMVQQMFYDGLISTGAEVLNTSPASLEQEVLDVYYMFRDCGYFKGNEFSELVEFCKKNPNPQIIDPELKAFVQFIKNDVKNRSSESK